RLPGAFASVSTSGTPTGAIVLLIAIQVVLIILAEGNDTLLALQGIPHYLSVFTWGATFGSIALAVVYLVLSMGGLFGLTDSQGRGGVVVASLVGIVVMAAAIFGSFYKVPSPTVLAPIYALAWGVLGLLYMLVVKGRAPASEALSDLRG
ncbi:MAG: hypothetical protein ACRDHC_10080, partial [Actinomycetota bacterium]